MMVQIGLGLAPRAPHALQKQPEQGLTLLVASDDASVAVKAVAMTIEVPAPSIHAGSYPLVLADLARGPVCLVAPAIRKAEGRLAVEPGLWAYDASRGRATIARQWLANGAVVENATGLTFAPVAANAAQDIVLVETVRQSGLETSRMSAPFAVPALAPEPARLNVAGDARVELVLDPAATAKVEIIEPVIHAGTHMISAAPLKNGPLWLTAARIQGTGQVGGQLTIAWRGLHVSDGAAGPVSLQGQWQRDGAPIPGAVAQTYQIQAADAGRRIGFVETAMDRNGATRQASNEIAIGGTL